MSIARREFLFICSLVLIVAIAGCDSFSTKTKSAPKNKTASAPVAAAKQEAAKPVDTKEEALPKNVLAKVGSWTITTDEFNERLKGVKQVVKDFNEKDIQSQKMVLDELIRQQLLVYEARQEKLDQNKEIQAAVKDFENTLIVQELAANLTKDVKATPEDAQQYYNANPDVFVMPVEKKVSEIVLPTQAEAKEVLVQALQGGDFSQLAKDKSKGKSALAGGNLGFVLEAPFDQMQRILDPMKKGDVSAVFEGPEGFYIVKVEDVRGGEKKSFEEVKEDLVKGLTLQKQQQAVLNKMNEIAEKIKVQVNQDILKDQQEK